MIQLYEIECANYEVVNEENPDPFIYKAPCLAGSLADAVVHLEAFLAEKHPNDRVVGGRMLVENVFVTNGIKDAISAMRREELANQTDLLVKPATQQDLIAAVKHNFPVPSDFKGLEQERHDALHGEAQ